MRQLLSALLVLLPVVAASGQSSIHLKNRAIDTVSVPFASLYSQSPQRVHRIVQFSHPPGAEDAQALVSRGVMPLAYVHENALMVSMDEAAQLDDLGVRWTGALAAEDKISGALEASTDAATVVVELHADADPALVRFLILSAGAELVDRPDASSRHLLARGTPAQIRSLADRDAVAYLFPASPDLIAGRPVVACASGLTATGAVGQYIAHMGEGWDGPGQGSATLTYSWGGDSNQLSEAVARPEILRAFAEWQKVAGIHLSETGSAGGARNINVMFARLSHGDGYAFDGKGSVLAHTFYPPPNAEPLAGDMHIDDDENWQIGVGLDLFSVALHELGHAFGLGHSDHPGDVMYPYYARTQQLTANDIAAIQTLYAAPTATTPGDPDPPATPTPGVTLTLDPTPSSTTADTLTVSGSAHGGTGSIAIAASSDRGWSGSAAAAAFSFSVALASGRNTITIVATDANGSTSATVTVTRETAPAAAPVVLQVTDPAAATYSTATAAIVIRGIASHPSGIREVRWVNGRGGLGTAVGTTSWSTGNIALQRGDNAITLTAVAGDGTVGSIAVQITLQAQTAQGDTTAPSIAISSPANRVGMSSAASVVVQGTASDNVGVVRVEWTTATGASGSATGTTKWQTTPIPLYPGFNTIQIRAWDAAGNMAWRSLQVTRM